MDIIAPNSILYGNVKSTSHFYVVVTSREGGPVEAFFIFGETARVAENRVFDFIQNQRFKAVEVYEPKRVQIKMKRMPKAFFRKIAGKIPQKSKTALLGKFLRLEDLKVVNNK